MRKVRIATLKARLSEYLRAVRRGETVGVLDRETLIAQIIPAQEASSSRPLLRIRERALGAPPLHRIPLPKPANLPVDVVQFLLEERQGYR